MYEEVTTLAEESLKSAFRIKDVIVMWQTPRERGRGDLATTIALELAKKLQRKPMEIAETLSSALRKNISVEHAEAVAPGYVNITLSPGALLRELHRSREAQTARVASKNARPVIVDYSGPNIAKPLGIHHILSTIIGQAIVNLHRYMGNAVVGWSYPGDWGTQFGKLSVAFERWGSGKPAKDCTIDELLELYVRFHKEAEKDPALEDQAREAFHALEKGDVSLRGFWEDVVAVTRKALEKIYRRLDVHLDVETGESFYQDKMKPIIEEGQEKGVFTEGEKGALIVQFSPDSNLPPLMLRKSDGSTLYATRDLAMIRYRLDSYHPVAIYYVVDVAQSLHFQQLFAAASLLEWELPKLEHTVFGRMRFADASMSTRKGTVLKLEHVLDEAVRRATEIIEVRGETIQTDNPGELAEMMGVGALVYGILSQNRKMDIVFDWDKMLSFEGNSAPYIQYTHARACSVMRKAKADVVELPKDIDSLTEKERLLIGTLLRFSKVLEDALETRMPHKIANYLYELCQDYNAFYNAEPILKAEESSKNLRLALTSFTASVLKTGARILTLRVPERM